MSAALESYKETRRLQAERNRKRLQALKDSPCVDCGIKYPPCVMEWDHRPDQAKILNLGKMTTYKFKTLTLIKREEVEEWKKRQK